MFLQMKKTAKVDSNSIVQEDADIGAKFKAARELAGLTQPEVAIRAGWFKEDNETPNQQRVSHYEVGRRKLTLIDAMTYADAVGIDLAVILGLHRRPVKPRT
jgi:transcriptional regulator with XRE-family HTH domain